jgi:hypothetical protein
MLRLFIDYVPIKEEDVGSTRLSKWWWLMIKTMVMMMIDGCF